MLPAVILALGIVAGVPGVVLGALAVAVFAPLPVGLAALTAAVAVSLRSRPPDPVDDESVFLRAVAAELRAGATLRAAAVAAADRVPGIGLDRWVRHAAAGRTMADLAPSLGTNLPISGRAVAAAIAFLSVSGGSAADVFARLADQTDASLALDRERRIATAQARLSAVVVAAAPVPVLVWLAARGTLGDLLSSSIGVLVLGTGLGLEVVGVGAVALMLRRGPR